MTEPATRKRGTGWIVFAGTVLVLAGAEMFINGLWSLHSSTAVANTFRGRLLFSDDSLDTWGWIYVVLGLVVMAAGICVFLRIQWARFVGVLAATVQAIFAFFWVFSPSWVSTLVIILVDCLVIYALVTYGDRELRA